MSISSAFNGALSGLQAFGKMSEVISSNIANATTPGYGKRSVVLASNDVAAGVGVVTISRNADPVIISARRTAEAQFAGADLIADFQAQVMQNIGTPDNPTSLTARLADLEASLIEAASFPDAPARLDKVVLAAQDVTDALNSAANVVSDLRSAADRSIGIQVERLNTALRDVDALNTQIANVASRGINTAGLLDQRQLLIDEINTIVPVREIARPNGQVALFSDGGAILLDGLPADIGFDPVNTVTPYQSLSAGTLSGLTINGVAVDAAFGSGPLRGGTLGANFTIRDKAAIAVQSQLDAVARDLISRFQDPAVDPTLSAGTPGLLTDAGGVFIPSDEVGLASRIAINTLVDPSGASETWRLRTGFGAATPGPVGDGRLLNALRDAFATPRMVASGDFGPGALTSASLVSHLTSWVGIENDRAERKVSFFSASYSEIAQAELSAGVDTDAELQNLMLVERAYAANARVLQTVDDMLETLLRIG